METDYLSPVRFFYRVTPSSSHRLGSVSSLGSTGSRSVGIFAYHSMSALLHLRKSSTSGKLGVECYQPSYDIQVSNVFLLLVLVLLIFSKFLTENVTVHWKAPYSSGTLLDWGFLASHSSQHVGRHFFLLFYHTKLWHGCFDGLGA